MRIHELTAPECFDVLGRTNLGRLGCAHDNQPYIIPIHFYLDGGHVYSFATQGLKVEWMRSNPKVCLEVDDIIDSNQWTSVVVFGRYEELTLGPEHEEPRRRALALFEKRPEWWQPAAGKLPDKEHHVPVVYRIRVKSVSGRRAARTAQ
jgi:nitroimidazol reductase NimA-like FMN-containing flavoprotein (pyridoxamine 5'-phosphate oxidase superfamily)